MRNNKRVYHIDREILRKICAKCVIGETIPGKPIIISTCGAAATGISSVEPFHITILMQLSLLYKDQPDSPFDHVVKFTDDLGIREVGIQSNVQRFPIKFVDHVEGPEWPSANQSVVHKIHSTMEVRPDRLGKWH